MKIVGMLYERKLILETEDQNEADNASRWLEYLDMRHKMLIAIETREAMGKYRFIKKSLPLNAFAAGLCLPIAIVSILLGNMLVAIVLFILAIGNGLGVLSQI